MASWPSPGQGSDVFEQLLERLARGRCPKCGAALVTVPYRGVELDKCSRCQGVWLDVGELDQVIGEDTGFLGSVKRIFQ